MKIHRFKQIFHILSISIFFIGNSFNTFTKAAPINHNIFELFQNIDKESNLTANTNKVVFKLILDPVDDAGNLLNFHLKLKSTLWLTSDEFTTLKNYLSDTDLSNALRIIRRKFFRRYQSKDINHDDLKYKLLSTLAFTSIQGQVHLLRNRLNDVHPEILLLVTGYKTSHRDPNEWKPLTSTSEDFMFVVENGPGQTTSVPAVTVSSEYDNNYYERILFNGIKQLGVTSGHAPEVSPEHPSPVNQEPHVEKFEDKHQPKLPEQHNESSREEPDNPVPTEEVKSNEQTEPNQTRAPESAQNQEATETPNQPQTTQPPTPDDQPRPYQPTQNVQEVQPTESYEAAPNEMVHPVESDQSAESNKPAEVSGKDQLEPSVQPVQPVPAPQPDQSAPVDNNVVDKDNPVPTEEVKSNEQTEPNQTRAPESAQNQEATEQVSSSPQPENKDLTSDTLSNVRKGENSDLKTTFSLEGSEDVANKPKFYQKADQDEGSISSESSDSDEESVENEPTSGKTKEELLAELRKQYPEYNETDLMNKFERVDREDIAKDFKSPLTITMKIDFLSSDKRISVPAITTARLLLPEQIFTMCIREELTQQCAFELKDRLMARFEDTRSEAFKWGRLISLLQTLAFQNDVFIEKYVMQSGEESLIEVAKPAFVLPMKTLNFLSQLTGKASSSDNQAYISFELLPGPLNIPLNSVASDLGQNYGVHAQLSRFIDMYTDFEVTHSLFDLPNRKRVFKKGASQRAKKSRGEGNKVYTMDELLSMNVDTKDLSNDIHFILSSYEKALYSVPKRLSGYKLLWETVDKYPELQRIWIEALTLMKLMDKKDNLRNFLANHTFKYQELKDLFEITYGIIAADNYDSVRDFYETVGITQKDVDTNLARVKSLFFAKTGSNVTRLPPMLKPMHQSCLVKNMITSLTSNDVIERMQVMYVQWINEYKNSSDSNYDLAFLCSGSAVLLQHWHYFQLDQGYYDPPVPFITLITSFSRLAQGKYKNPERKKEIKALINSKAAKRCRKYINAAGIMATSPYKTATINLTPKSLLGAIGNALDVSMDSPPLEIAYAMKDYFKAELGKGRYGNSLGICMGLQLLHRLNTCLSVERSNDFSVYMHGLLTMDTRLILERYTEIEANAKDINKNHKFLKFACTPDNPTVHEAMTKLMPLISTQSHLDLMDELVRREMLSPDLTPEGLLATNDETLNKDVVNLEDDTTTLLETFEDTSPRSLLEIADEVSYGLDEEDTGAEGSEDSFIQQEYTHGGYSFDLDPVGMPDFDSMDTLYKKLFSPSMVNNFIPSSLNHKVFTQLFNPHNSFGRTSTGLNGSLDDDLALITFDIRMMPSDDTDELVALDVPFSFHEKELDLIESLESTALLRLLLYRIKKRIDSLEFDLKHEQLKKQALELAKARNVEHISIPVHEMVAKGNVDLNTYRSLLRVLESMPEDGFYFEDEGLAVPNERAGRLAAKRIYKSLYRNKKRKSSKKSSRANPRDFDQPVMILQIIDPVDDTDINELTMPHDHVKKHDKLFYEKMTEL
ncbi:hypothetical protein MACK_001727 [Theileria orientalis]|uniref:Uncharacterized protein n=1 Tax=Theileria orientalis TaxID=68886 RepID=A0A976QUZ3_THEOR|nr:hypothetical protein MACK_001727 [Theileria orientalis]